MFGSKKTGSDRIPCDPGPPLPTSDDDAYALREKARIEAATAWHRRRPEVLAAMPPPHPAYQIVRNTEKGTWTVQRGRNLPPEPPPSTEMLDDYTKHRRPGLYISAVPDWAYYDFSAPEDQWAPARVVYETFGPTAEFDTLELAERWLMGWIDPISDVIPYDDGGQRLPRSRKRRQKPSTTRIEYIR